MSHTMIILRDGGRVEDVVVSILDDISCCSTCALGPSGSTLEVLDLLERTLILTQFTRGYHNCLGVSLFLVQVQSPI